MILWLLDDLNGKILFFISIDTHGLVFTDMTGQNIIGILVGRKNRGEHCLSDTHRPDTSDMAKVSLYLLGIDADTKKLYVFKRVDNETTIVEN